MKVAILLSSFMLFTPVVSYADDTSASTSGNALEILTQQATPAEHILDKKPPTSLTPHPKARYEWRIACNVNPASNDGQVPACVAPTCRDDQSFMRRWRLSPPPVQPIGTACVSNAIAEAAAPTVTPAIVARAFRRIPLPELASIAQPDKKTLINFDTIFHTDARSLTRNLTLLGQQIRLEIRPSRFTWVWGDGTTSTTTTPGAAYPDKSVVHRYQQAHTTVRHRVSITWTARWALNGGPMQPVPGSVRTTGASTALRIAEASPTLSGEGY